MKPQDPENACKERMEETMKRNTKFFAFVILLLLASSLALAGGMYAIAAGGGEMRDYDLEVQKRTHESIAAEDAPPTQDSMQTKFEAMYDISEDGKTITVISEDYLKAYWKSNYEKEVIRSLTAEEVYFIIRDSIRIYSEYDRVILAGFDSVPSDRRVAERFPLVEAQEIRRPVTSLFDRDRVKKDIHTIILYRLRALSSPGAFFTGTEAIRFCGGDPVTYNGPYSETVFYIPGYSETTDRDYILSVCGGSADFTDLNRFSDLFAVSALGEPVIEFSSVANGSSVKVYPTAEMESR